MGFRCSMGSEQRNSKNSAVVSGCNPCVSNACIDMIPSVNCVVNAWIHFIISVNYVANADIRKVTSVSYDACPTCLGVETFRVNILLISPGCTISCHILISSIILYDLNFTIFHSQQAMNCFSFC